MRNKVMSLSEGVACIENGGVVAIGNQKPMAVIREMVRQGKRELTIYVMIGDHEVDLLCGAGCVKELHGLFVTPASGPHFRNGVQKGEVRMIDEGEAPLHLSVYAGAMNLPFIPLRGYENDIVSIHPEWKRFASPLTGEDLLAVPALVPDVAILHMPRSDVYGNVQSEDAFVYDRTMGWWDKHITMAARTSIVSVEEVVDGEVIRAHPDRTFLPFYDVDVVLEAPKGGHPRGLPGSYEADAAHLQMYGKASRDAGTFQAYLDKYIHGVKDNGEYLALVDAASDGGGGS